MVHFERTVEGVLDRVGFPLDRNVPRRGLGR